jgi:hypothetical protein
MGGLDLAFASLSRAAMPVYVSDLKKSENPHRASVTSNIPPGCDMLA